MDTAAPQELFSHIRIVMGMVIGLGITRMLLGIAGFIQHPGRNRVSLLHMLWVGSILLELVLFWWWEFALSRITSWSFGVFLFQGLGQTATDLILLGALPPVALAFAAAVVLDAVIEISGRGKP